MTDIQHLGLAEPVPPKAVRRARGRELRADLPRGTHAGWEPPAGRLDPVSAVRRSNAGRVPELLEIRVGRMAASPFNFLRASPDVMAADLAHTPSTGLHVWLCGDANLSNFGFYASPERDLVFDINDFDESIAGPWEWDLKRLAVSLVVAGRERGLHAKDNRAAATAAVAQYRHTMRRRGDHTLLELFTLRLDGKEYDQGLFSKSFNAELRRSRRNATARTNDPGLKRFTVSEQDGTWRFEEQPPLLVRGTDEQRAEILAALETYTDGLLADRRDLIRSYHLVDVAFKVTGVGSVGTRSWVAALQGGAPDDALFLQIQQAGESALAPFVEPQPYAHPGQRVVDGQRRIQSVSDPFLGWTSFGGHDYYVRQLRDMKGAVDPTRLSAEQLHDYARVCGGLLAKAHARTGDPVAIAGYCGNSDSLDRAIADFAQAYADQNHEDWKAVKAAIEDGRLSADTRHNG